MTGGGALVRAGTLMVAVAVCTPGLAGAQTNHWERGVASQLQQAVTALRSRGFERARLTRRGSLNAEESESFAVTLETGRSYSVIGVCDVDCTGLGLVLSNAARSELAAAQTGDNVPVLEFTPRVGMAYRVRVVMAGCRLNPCWYGVAVVEKR